MGPEAQLTPGLQGSGQVEPVRPAGEQVIVPEELMEKLRYLVDLAQQLEAALKTNQAMLIAASDAQLVLSQDTQALLETFMPDVRDGVEVELINLTGRVRALATALYQNDGLRVTHDQLATLLERLDKGEYPT